MILSAWKKVPMLRVVVWMVEWCCYESSPAGDAEMVTRWDVLYTADNVDHSRYQGTRLKLFCRPPVSHIFDQVRVSQF